MSRSTPIHAVVFDVGHVLYGWDIAALYRKLIADDAKRDWFLSQVVTPEWHFQHDRGRSIAETIPELQAQYPAEAALIEAYRTFWLETITGPVAGMPALVSELVAAKVPLAPALPSSRVSHRGSPSAVRHCSMRTARPGTQPVTAPWTSWPGVSAPSGLTVNVGSEKGGAPAKLM